MADTFSVGMAREARHKRPIVRVHYSVGDTESKEIERPLDRVARWDELQEVNRQISQTSGSSVFFPTFRRIEGGFSIASRQHETVRFVDAGVIGTAKGVYFGGDQINLQNAMNQLSERMSVGGHRFVASTSTDDINRLLTSKYAEVSEQSNRLSMEMSAFILAQVGNGGYRGQGTSEQERMQHTLGEIQRRARNVKETSESLLRPFTVLSELVEKIFQYKGIKLAGPVTLGKASEAILSDVLSAGEKQMLSFLCYNAFANRTCIFIDEPEISLHVDWQRTLFPVLLGQSTGNQFIVATHSPFIYTKYADKELVLGELGDNDANAKNDGRGDNKLPAENSTPDAIGRR